MVIVLTSTSKRLDTSAGPPSQPSHPCSASQPASSPASTPRGGHHASNPSKHSEHKAARNKERSSQEMLDTALVGSSTQPVHKKAVDGT